MRHVIPECNYDRLCEQIQVLNKKAKKLNSPPITISDPEVDHVICEVLRSDGRDWIKESDLERISDKTKITGKTMNMVAVEVCGETPRLNGWEIVAILEPIQTDDGSVENLVRVIPGHECPVEFRSRIGQCDHCNTSRNRKETFVVRHPETMSHKCVGRQCLKDFLGYHGDPNGFAAAAELLWSLGQLIADASDFDEFSGGFRTEYSYRLKTVLTWTSSIVRQAGWKSRGTAREQGAFNATADRVWDLLNPPNPVTKEWKEVRDSFLPNEDDQKRAELAIEWARSLEDLQNDYLYNCNLVSRVGFATYKTIGIACSILVAYDKAMGRIREHEKAKNSEWQGEIGKRREFTLTCLNIFNSEGSYGTTGIHKLTDENGNQFTWFASESAKWFEVGQTATVKATVKDHGEYRGIKQTVLSRVKVPQEEINESMQPS